MPRRITVEKAIGTGSAGVGQDLADATERASAFTLGDGDFHYERSGICRVNRSDVFQPRLDLALGIIEVVFTFEDSGSLAAVYFAAFAAPLRVFAPTVASAADASALPALSSHQPCLAPSVGALALVSAGASVAPVLASQRAFPRLAGISCPALGCLCWKCSGVH